MLNLPESKLFNDGRRKTWRSRMIYLITLPEKSLN